MRRYLAWSTANQIVLIIIQLIYGVISARVIGPNVFGYVAVPLLIISFGRMLVDGGIGGALVRDKNVSNISYSTVFFSALFIGLLFYFILFFSSNIIADLYEYKGMKVSIEISALTILFFSSQVAFNAYILKQFKFREKFLITVPTAVFASLASIYFIINYNPVFGLMMFPFLNALTTSLFYIFIFRKILTGYRFSSTVIKNYLSFGVNTTLGLGAFSFFEWLFQSLILLRIGATTSGAFLQSKKFTDLMLNIFRSNISNVFYSVFANDKKYSRQMMIKIIADIGVLYYLLSIASLFILPRLVLIILGDGWREIQTVLPALLILGYTIFVDSLFRIIHKVENRSKFLRNYDLLKVILLISFTYLYYELGFQSLKDLLCFCSILWMICLLTANVRIFENNLIFYILHLGMCSLLLSLFLYIPLSLVILIVIVHVITVLGRTDILMRLKEYL